MTDPNKTLIVALIDRTGSMSSIKSDAEGAFDHFMDEQRKLDVDQAFVSLYQFDHTYGDTPPVEMVYEWRPIADVPKLVIEPRGSTPLLDACGLTITSVGADLAGKSEDERPSKVLFVIVTDGEENASTEYDNDRVKKLVEEQTERWSWEFFFLGAGIDAFAVGGGMGIPKHNTVSVAATPEGVSRGYAAASAMVADARTR